VTPAEGRALFPVLERYAYMNAGTLGPLAQPTLDAVEQRARYDQEQGRGGREWFESVLELRDRVRQKLASLVGAVPDSVALTSSTTDGCNIVVAGLALQPGDEVVTTNSEHPGLLLPLAVSGATVRVADVADRPVAEAVERITALVGPKTRLLALSHVLWTTGQVMPVQELKQVTGLPVLVDGAQSVGAIPVDVGEADYLTVSGQKWLCSPYWAQTSIEPDGTFLPREGAARFDSGWLATQMLAGWEAALDLRPEWSFERAAAITEQCRNLLAEKHQVIGEPGQGTLVSFVPPADPAETVAALFKAGVVVRELPGTGWVRASCGWWTNEDDLDRLAAGLEL
jgi:L-cysteine/cystine lyase